MCSHINTSPVHRAHITPRNTGLIGGSRHLELSILSSRTCTELSERKWSVYYMSDSPCVSVCAGMPWCVFVSICVWKPLFTEPVGSCDKQKKKRERVQKLSGVFMWWPVNCSRTVFMWHTQCCYTRLHKHILETELITVDHIIFLTLFLHLTAGTVRANGVLPSSTGEWSRYKCFPLQPVINIQPIHTGTTCKSHASPSSS